MTNFANLKIVKGRILHTTTGTESFRIRGTASENDFHSEYELYFYADVSRPLPTGILTNTLFL